MLEVEVGFVAAEANSVAGRFRALLNLARLASIEDFVDAVDAAVGPDYGERVDAALVAYVHDDVDVHLVHAPPHPIFRQIIHRCVIIEQLFLK